MNSAEAVKPRPRLARRWKIGALVATYLIAFSATVPFIETGEARAMAEVHTTKSLQCRQFEQQARASGQTIEADRLAQSARNHDWFAATYRARAKQAQLTWLTWLVKKLVL